MSQPLLDVQNLKVSFSFQKKELQAVRGVSFALNRGESIGIVGESGSGKSSVARAIVRLLRLSQVSGHLFFEGRDLLQVSEEEMRLIRGKNMGMIFQDPMNALNPTMKIGDQIAEGLIHHKMASVKEAKEKALNFLIETEVSHPQERMNQYPHQLSGGMLQRVLIAIALSVNPSLLIADEPTTALDVTVQAQILDLFKRRMKGKALLLITHDLSIVSRLCDQICVMYAGKIVEQGRVEEILQDPRHPYTQMLLQARPRMQGPSSFPLYSIEGAPPNPLFPLEGCSFAPRCPFRDPICHKEPPLLGQTACWKKEEKLKIKSAIDLPLQKEYEKAKDVLIQVEGLSKCYSIGKEDFFAVKDLHFSIRRGDILGVVGESGSGKSTLAKLLLRLIPATSGHIFFEGEEITHVRNRSLCRKIQIIFQDPYAALNPRMTVDEILREPLLIHKLPDRVDELLDLVGLPQSAKERYPHEFSGGQKQRIVIARALSVNPSFLVCDEPISSLDVSIQAQMINLLLRLQKELQLTYLFIGHDLAMIRHIATHVAVMHEGEFVEMGPVESLYRTPKHPFTQALLQASLSFSFCTPSSLIY